MVVGDIIFLFMGLYLVDKKFDEFCGISFVDLSLNFCMMDIMYDYCGYIFYFYVVYIESNLEVYI